MGGVRHHSRRLSELVGGLSQRLVLGGRVLKRTSARLPRAGSLTGIFTELQGDSLPAQPLPVLDHGICR